jgi:hypothetical protein
METITIYLCLVVAIVLISIYITHNHNKTSYVTIKAVGGLCNKLRTTFSWHKFAKSQNKHLNVVWIPNDECPGFFLDFFKPVDGITFYKTDINKNVKIDYNGWDKHPQYNNVYLYDELNLNSDIKSEVEKVMKKLTKEYMAIHVRRTDHVALAKKNNSLTTDEEFFEFVENKKNNNVKIYLATDNPNTQDLFFSKYGNRIVVNDKINPNNQNNNNRMTSLKDAIIDLFVCSNAKYFKGSGFSSFSDFIQEQRTNKFNL